VLIVVPGVPEPKGSVKLIRRGAHNVPIMGGSFAGHERLKEWAFRVASYARRAMAVNAILEPQDGPLAVDVTFYLPRPQSAPKRRIHALTRPDLDKLLRGALDPLKGIVIVEDSRIVSASCRKLYAGPDDPPGATIHVWSV